MITPAALPDCAKHRTDRYERLFCHRSSWIIAWRQRATYIKQWQDRPWPEYRRQCSQVLSNMSNCNCNWLTKEGMKIVWKFIVAVGIWTAYCDDGETYPLSYLESQNADGWCLLHHSVPNNMWIFECRIDFKNIGRGRVLSLPALPPEVSNSVLVSETSHPDWNVSWFSSTPLH